ncbi:MAG: hypothetical protein WCE79_18720 [Xanthobacteraceae bacterium]
MLSGMNETAHRPPPRNALKRTAAVLALLILFCVVWFFATRVTRSDLGIAAEHAAGAPACGIPLFADLRIYPRKDKSGNVIKDESGKEIKDPNYEVVANEYLQYGVASSNAYGKDQTFVLSSYDRDWQPVDLEAIGLNTPHWNGFDLRAFKKDKQDPVEILIAFRGTDEAWKDGPLWDGIKDWFFGNGSWITQWVPWWDQYRDARRAVQLIRQRAEKAYAGRPVFYTATGHSLGGGLSVHVARAFPCTRAIVFNPSCVTNEFRLAKPFPSQTVVISETGDPLTGICARFFELKHGGPTHVYAGANLILKKESARAQHSIEKYSAGMARMAVCCAQTNERGFVGKSKNECSCDKSIMASYKKAYGLFCGEFGRLENDAACDFKSKRAVEEQCVRSGCD